MELNTLKNILDFLEENEDREIPYSWYQLIRKNKLIEELENHPEGEQYKTNYDISLSASKIKKLPNDLHVGGDLSLYNCEELKELPDKLYVGGDLWLSGSGISELPKYLFVKGDLWLARTPLLKKYTVDELYDAVKLGGGRIPHRIFK
jgi:hypothetical protein